jgi:transposase-like protein
MVGVYNINFGLRLTQSMGLSPSLYNLAFQNPCPSCGVNHEKTGRWFAIVAKYQCQNCDHLILLTYQKKVELFAKHQKLKAGNV